MFSEVILQRILVFEKTTILQCLVRSFHYVYLLYICAPVMLI